jgi:hypothetical protein
MARCQTGQLLSLVCFGQVSAWPEGFHYKDEIISGDQELTVANRLVELPFEAFLFRGFLGKRRVVSFGWRYDFNTQELQRTEAIPDFLVELRNLAAAFSGIESSTRW